MTAESDLDAPTVPRDRWRLPLAVGGLLLLYVTLSVLVDPRAWSGSDPGGKVATLRAMEQRGDWSPSVGYWAEELDPDGSVHPLLNTRRVGEEWVQVTSLPMVYAAAPLWRAGGPGLIRALPMAGGLIAALAARSLARRLGDPSGWPAFWMVGAASPVLFYVFDFWEHTPALGLALAALALLVRDKLTFAVGAAAGLLLGAAVVLRRETAIFFAVYGLLVLATSSQRRRWVESWRVVLAIVAATLTVVVAEVAAERIVFGEDLLFGRSSMQVAQGGEDPGSRFAALFVTTIGMIGDDSTAAVVLSLITFGGLVLVGLGARWHDRSSDLPNRLVALGALVSGFSYLSRLVDPQFVPGVLSAQPGSVAAITTRRDDPSWLLVWAAVGTIPLTILLQWRGSQTIQWGGRYMLLSGSVLTVAGTIGLRRAGWRSPAAIASVALTAVASAAGIAWQAHRTSTVVRAAEELVDVPDGTLILTTHPFGREAGAFYAPDALWLEANHPDELAEAVEVATRAGITSIDVTDQVPVGTRRAPPELPGYEPVSSRVIPYGGGDQLVVTRYQRTGSN